MAPPLAKTASLNSDGGDPMPMIGLGLGTFVPKEACTEAIKTAMMKGYRHFDGAWFYKNEKEVAEGLKAGLEACEGKVKREDLFITSKLWVHKLHPEDVESLLRESLSNLGLDYVDLYLVHAPFAFARGEDPVPKDEEGNVVYDESITPSVTWPAMERLVEKGLAKNIGVSNFNANQLKEVLECCKIKPAVLQVELHPFLPQEELHKLASDNGIVVTAYSPLGAGHGKWERAEEAKDLLKDKKLEGIGEKYGKTPSQVILRWITQRGIVAVPKSSNPDRIQANLDVFDFDLTEDEMNTVSSFDLGPKRGRFCKFQNVDKNIHTHKQHPF